MWMYYPYFIAVSIIAILILCYAEWVEPRWFKIRQVTIKFPKAPSKPIQILHLSDIHFAGKNKLHEKKFFEKLNELNPDLIFITGDIIDCNEGIDQAVSILGKLKAKVGKFAILGNHDYWDYHLVNNFEYHLRGLKISDRPNNVELFVKKLESNGIKRLKNQNIVLTINGKKVMIAGTDDPVTGKVDFKKTFENMPSDSLNILLTHVLDAVVEMPKINLDLVFSGHTHGGQFRLPFIGAFILGFRLPRKYLDGIHQLSGFTACVSRGIGASRTLILRFFCRPEAILMEVSS